MELKYFSKFDPLKDQRVEIMDAKGKITHPQLMPKISDEVVLEKYKLMCLSRQQDDWQNKVQRQGRMLSFLSSTGQEACEVAYGMHIVQGQDWLSSAYRNNAAWLASGVPMRNIMMYWTGNEMGSKMPENVNTLPVNIPIATQYSHANGLAFAEKYRGTKNIAITTTGDGGSSEGEFYEAMNFGKLHELPVIYCVENNKFAISTPSAKATKALNFAVKGIAVGIPSIKVDGNDFFACFGVVEEAVKLARSGAGPTLIEFETYRLGAHSSSDDPKVYRNEKEFEAARLRDPLIRLKNYLITKKLWSEKDQEKLDAEQLEFVKGEFSWVEQNNAVALPDVFNYTYASLTENLSEQLAEAEAFFAKKGGN